MLAIFLGTLAFSYIDTLFAQSTPEIRTYNPHTGYREVILEGSLPSPSRDISTDQSFQKFLDEDNPFTTTTYKPNDLVAITSHFTHNDASKFWLREEAAFQFADMARAFANTFNFKQKLSIVSAYRSPMFQASLARNCSTTRCASAGTSEHEAGLALDLGVNGGNILWGWGTYYQRLANNAHLYGFHNTYQKGFDIDGKMIEPRHWRYVGVELATHLHITNQSFAEFFYGHTQ